MLLNNRIVTFNPETIITPAGKKPPEIYLLLAGKVEMLTQDPRNSHFLFSGSLLAEPAAIYDQPSDETYRSVGFVKPCACRPTCIAISSSASIQAPICSPCAKSRNACGAHSSSATR